MKLHRTCTITIYVCGDKEVACDLAILSNVAQSLSLRVSENIA